MVYEKDKIDFRILGDSNYKLIKGLQQDIYTRNWNEGEIEHLLKKGGGQGLIIYLSKKPIGYCLFRNLVDEAEILSLEIKYSPPPIINLFLVRIFHNQFVLACNFEISELFEMSFPCHVTISVLSRAFFKISFATGLFEF